MLPSWSQEGLVYNCFQHGRKKANQVLSRDIRKDSAGTFESFSESKIECKLSLGFGVYGLGIWVR